MQMRYLQQQNTWIILFTWITLEFTTTYIPSFITVAHILLWIFDFLVISQSEQICKWDIKYVHLLTTDHMGNICAYHYQHTKFHHCLPYRTLDTCICLLLANQNMQMRYLICASTTTEHMGNTSVHYHPHTKFCHCSPYRTLDTCLFCYLPIRTNMQMSYLICAFGDDRPRGQHLCLPLPTSLIKNRSLHSSEGLPFWLTSNLHTSFRHSWQPTKN